MLARLSCLFVALLLFSACAWQGDGKAPGEEVHKSPVDDRDYRYLTLANGLEVLMISDPDADKAAASLSVNVGSFQNPKDREGLAHFLEHMLFLGTEKYPEAGAYQAFISEHGGRHNAYTSIEETNYFFDVDADHLTGALDRFSQFFVAPLFTPEFVDRERQAVESEYRLKLKDDTRREWDILRELANPDHPFSKFSVGTLETLADRPGSPVRDELLDFYRRFYSADNMNLVVLGRQQLDQLEALIIERFDAVPDRNLELADEPIPLFGDDLPLKVAIEPEKEIRKLSFNFPVPSVSEHWQTKPLVYLGHLLGHEGQGSLLQQLKSQGLAEGLMAGMVFDSRAGALFNVSIMLTPAGIEQQDTVTRAFFAWLDLVRQQGIEAWRYQEVAEMGRLEFLYREEGDPAGYVRQLSSLMHTYPATEVVRGPSLYRDFDPTLIARYTDRLRPGNALITLTAPSVQTEKTSAYYQAPYRVERVSVDELTFDGWRERLALPEPNPYVPDSLTLHRPEAARKVPKRIEMPGGDVLWHYPDTQFDTPKAVFAARLAVPDSESLDRETLLDLYIAMVNDSLSAQVYPASVAGLGFQLSRWENGLDLQIQGYSDKQDVLLKTVIEHMASPQWRPEQFERVKASLARQWRNQAKDWPISRTLGRLPALVRGAWLPAEKAGALESVGLQDLQAFARSLFGNGHGTYYAGGNLDDGAAVALARSVATGLELDGGVSPVRTIQKLTAGRRLPEFFTDVDHADEAAVLYIQGREDTLQERALVALLQIATEAPFYSTLRTEKQLGYVVGNGNAHMDRVPGLMFYVQSPVANTETLQREIDEFLAAFERQSLPVAPEQLQRYKAAVLTNILKEPKNLGELAQRHLESLHLGFNDFNFRQLLAASIEAVNAEAFGRAYRGLLREERPGLWILSEKRDSFLPVERDRVETMAQDDYRYRR